MEPLVFGYMKELAIVVTNPVVMLALGALVIWFLAPVRLPTKRV